MSFSGEKTKQIYGAVFGVALNVSSLHMFVPLVCVFYSFCNDGSVKWEMQLNCSIHN